MKEPGPARLLSFVVHVKALTCALPCFFLHRFWLLFTLA